MGDIINLHDYSAAARSRHLSYILQQEINADIQASAAHHFDKSERHMKYSKCAGFLAVGLTVSTGLIERINLPLGVSVATSVCAAASTVYAIKAAFRAGVEYETATNISHNSQ